MLFCICINIVIIVLSVGASYFAYRKSLLSTIGSNRSDVLSQVGGRVRDFKRNAYTISNLYWNDERFNALAQTLSPDTIGDFSLYMNELTHQYQISFNQVNLEYYMVYLSVDGLGYCSAPVPPDYDYMNPEIRIWYKDMYEAGGGIVDIASYKDRTMKLNSFVVARTVLSPDGAILGYLMINVKERQIFNSYYDVVAPDSTIYISDDGGNIISSNLDEIVGFHYFSIKNLNELFGDAAYAIVQRPNHEALFSKYADPAYGFVVYEEIPLDTILSPILATRNQVIVVGGMVTLLGVVLAWIFTGRITRPILQLRDEVLRVENGEIETAFSLYSYAEINTLSLGLQQMLSRIRELLESEKRKEEQKRKMHYQLLQAQINPHFMYNTLFSIKCVVNMGENERASEMLTSFIQLLRSTLSALDSTSTVQEQCAALSKYVGLQKFRYGDCFDMIIEYEDAVSDCLLPQLLIQPLVENAILHGIVEHKRNCGVIAVSIRSGQQGLLIQVEDNGIGMTPEQIDLALNENGAQTDKPHIGLRNISDRIKLSFGEAYGLTIESGYDEGTKIVLTVPLRRKEEVKPDD